MWVEYAESKGLGTLIRHGITYSSLPWVLTEETPAAVIDESDVAEFQSIHGGNIAVQYEGE